MTSNHYPKTNHDARELILNKIAELCANLSVIAILTAKAAPTKGKSKTAKAILLVKIIGNK